MRPIVSVLFVLCSILELSAQVKGKVFDEETGLPIAGVMVKVLQEEKNIFTTTKNDGTFDFSKVDIPCTLTFSHLSYQSQKIVISSHEEVIYFLKSNTRVLQDVVVESPRIIQKGDTTTYYLGRFVSKRDASVSDALKRLPGVEVNKIGTVSYLGKPIDKLTIDGMDMLGKEYQSTINSLKRESVSRVEIMERQQEVKLLQDLVGDEKIVMNLVLNRNAREKINGNIELGIGGDHNEVAYKGATNLLYFCPRFQLNIDGAYGRNFDNDEQKLDGSIIRSSESLGESSLLSAISGTLNPPTPQIDEQFFSRRAEGKVKFNGIFQFKPSQTLRAKVNYHRANTRHTYGNDITFYTEEAEDIRLNENQIEVLEQVKYSNAEIRYIDNSRNYYLANDLNYRGTWSSQRSQIETPRLPVTQDVETRYHILENQLKYSKRINGKVYSFTGDIQYQNIPSVELSSEGIAQRFREETIGAAIGTSFLFPFGHSWRLSLPLKALLKSDRINNREQYIFGEKKLSLCTTPTLSFFKPGLIDLSLTVPVELLLLNYERVISGDNPKYSKLLISPNFRYMYRLSPVWSIEGALGYKREVGSLMDMFDVPYYTSYRIIVKSAGEVSGRGVTSFSNSLKYRNPMREIYGKIMLAASYSQNSQLYGDSPNSKMNQLVALIQDNVGYNLTGGADISKYFRKARTKLSAGITGHFSGFESKRFEEMIRSQVIGISPWATVQSELSSKFEVKYNISLSRSQMKYQSQVQAPLHSLNQRLSISYSPTDYFFVTLEGEHLGKEMNVRKYNHIALVNALAEYKSGKRIWKLSLHNLLNQQESLFTIYHATMSTSSWYQLRGFTGLFSYTYYF